MNAKRAAEIANDCNEGMTTHLRKSELVEAVRYWSLKSADKAANAHLRTMQKVISAFKNYTTSHNS